MAVLSGTPDKFSVFNKLGCLNLKYYVFSSRRINGEPTKSSGLPEECVYQVVNADIQIGKTRKDTQSLRH